MQYAIQQISRICKERLNPYQLTLSLLQEGIRVGVVSQQGMLSVQEQIMMILQDLILRYTNGESTSVKTETAESLLNSIMYALDAYIRSCAMPEECLAHFLGGGVKDAYEKGLRLVIDCVANTRTIYQEVKRNKLDVSLEVYHTSIDEALPGFFLHYNVLFNAHDTMCMLDYPLVFDDMKVQGVYYIWRYLDTLRTETQFCQFFDLEDVRRLLVLYGRVYRMDVVASPVNIFEIILCNALFAVLLKQSAGQLMITQNQYEMLREQLGDLTPIELESLVDAGIQVMIDGLGVTQPNLIEYIRRTKAILMQRITTAVEHDSLQNVILMDTDDTFRENRITFNSRDCMSDAAFRNVLKRGRGCASIAEKIAIVIAEIHALGDFTDLLEADFFYGEEFVELYAKLSDLELALIGSIVFKEELRTEALAGSAWLAEVKLGCEWQIWFVAFLRGISEERLNELIRKIWRLESV